MFPMIAAISAIPKIVCETIHALELHDETPSWKIMDNKGRVTVVLHWDQRSSTSQAQQQQKGQDVQTSKYSPTKKTDLSQRPPLVIQTSLDKLNYGGKLGHLAAEVGPSRYTSPHITVINHDDMVRVPINLLFSTAFSFSISRVFFSLSSTECREVSGISNSISIVSITVHWKSIDEQNLVIEVDKEKIRIWIGRRGRKHLHVFFVCDREEQ